MNSELFLRMVAALARLHEDVGADASETAMRRTLLTIAGIRQAEAMERNGANQGPDSKIIRLSGYRSRPTKRPDRY